jgi:DNA polymerase-3 subunit delta'
VSDFKVIDGFDPILGQRRALWLIGSLLQKRSLPHALLFVGMDGVGKQHTAMLLAMACNCERYTPEPVARRAPVVIKGAPANTEQTSSVAPCGTCRSCRKISSGHHPDVSLTAASGPLIKIDQIRDLCRTLAMKPYQAHVRVTVVADAHRMNPSASNALLKVLEEPPAKTVLILTATRTSDLLPTIVSRCQQIRFNPIPSEHIEALLVERHQMRPVDAAAIAIMANGSLSKALSMVRAMSRTNWINRRIWIINQVETMADKPMAWRMAFAEKLAKEKALLFDSLEVMKSWFRDLLVCKYQSQKLINHDLRDKIQQAAKTTAVETLVSTINDIQSVQNNIDGNINLRLSLEVLLLSRAGA